MTQVCLSNESIYFPIRLFMMSCSRHFQTVNEYTEIQTFSRHNHVSASNKIIENRRYSKTFQALGIPPIYLSFNVPNCNQIIALNGGGPVSAFCQLYATNHTISSSTLFISIYLSITPFSTNLFFNHIT